MDVLLVTDRWDAAGGGRERYLAELRDVLTRTRSVATITARELGDQRLQRQIAAFRQSHPHSPVLTVRPALHATHYQLHSGVYADAYAAEERSYDSLLRRALFRPALRMNMRRRRLLQLEARLCSTPSDTQLMVFSCQSKRHLQQRFGVPDHRIVVSRPGIDLSIFAPQTTGTHEHDTSAPPNDRDHVRVLFAGHNFVLKGLRWAIEAIADARRRGVNAHLVVAGRGPVRAFRTMAQRLDVASHVTFAGPVAQPALAELYRHSDLLMHPTFYDPFPRVIVEALASGVPVVTTRACGGAELIAAGDNGFVVDDPRNVQALADAIVAVANPQQRERMRGASAASGRQFDFERHAASVLTWLACA